MTATADRFLPGRSREELRLVEVASGLLLLLDAYRLTGRLPLDVQVQASRLRHAVKLAVQAEAARTATRPPAPPPAVASRDPSAALRAWIATQPWAQPGPQGWVYLLCFRDPATGHHAPLRGNGCQGQYAGHYWGWTDDLIRRINQHRNPLARRRPPRPGRPRGRADLRAGLVRVPGHPGPRAAAQEPRLRLPALPAVPRHRRPPRPSRGRGRRPPLPTPPTAACWKEVALMTRRTTWRIDMGDGTWAVSCMACRIALYRGPKAGADRAAAAHYCEPVVPLGRRRRPA